MSSQYDALADLSEQTAHSPLRKFYEEHTMFSALGDVQGRDVLDLGCGTGLYTRKLKERGARRVLGVDNSEGMVGYARYLEEREPRGVEYLVRDAARLGEVGTFDCVVGTYLLHYAPTRDELYSMCHAIRRTLAPGGSFVTVCMNPAINLDDPQYYMNYGFRVTGGPTDGALVTMEIILPGMETKLSAFRWSNESYDGALGAAGFEQITWHTPQLDPMGAEVFGEDFWVDYLARPHAVVISAVAPR